MQPCEERKGLTISSREPTPVTPWRDRECNEFEKAWLDAWHLKHNALPRHLYHYTTQKGAGGIVSDHAIWATDARCLADKTELVYVDDVIATVAASLHGRYSDGLPATFLDASCMHLLDTVRDWCQVYVACFCVEDDKLSQWCRYAPTGYAVGFDPDRMRTRTDLQLRCVLYDRGEQERLVSQVLERFADWLSNLTVAEPQRHLACVAALQETAHVLSECLFCFKHPSFRDEQEWRLVHIVTQELHQVNTPVRFREGHSGLASYVELHPNGQPPGVSGQLPISEVVISPNLPAEPTTSTMQSLLASAGYQDDMRVRSSVIPLRV